MWISASGSKSIEYRPQVVFFGYLHVALALSHLHFLIQFRNVPMKLNNISESIRCRNRNETNAKIIQNLTNTLPATTKCHRNLSRGLEPTNRIKKERIDAGIYLSNILPGTTKRNRNPARELEPTERIKIERIDVGIDPSNILPETTKRNRNRIFSRNNKAQSNILQ